MTQESVQFTFGSDIPIREVQGTLHLARLAAESLHGIERVRLETKCSIDEAARVIEIDRSTKVGRTLCWPPVAASTSGAATRTVRTIRLC